MSPQRDPADDRPEWVIQFARYFASPEWKSRVRAAAARGFRPEPRVIPGCEPGPVLAGSVVDMVLARTLGCRVPEPRRAGR